MRITDFLKLRWEDDGSPLIEPRWNSPILADPSFLFPSETPGKHWVLFAHTVWGIRRYESEDGIRWADRGTVIRNAMRPFCRFMDGAFRLYYEAYRPFAVVAQILPKPPVWKSHIELRSSTDLKHWSHPQIPFPEELDWMEDKELGKSISNPCLITLPQETGETDASHGADGAYRLYFSASLSYISDCGFCEPRYIGAAHGPKPEGPFTALPLPIIDPRNDRLPGVLGAGSVKVISLDDGFVGLQNKIYRDEEGHSRSALFILSSEDGLSWEPAQEEPLLSPSEGWRSSHVYACDCRQDKDGTWYLYYNARDGWYKSRGKERIGRLVGRS